VSRHGDAVGASELEAVVGVARAVLTDVTVLSNEVRSAAWRRTGES
jgi:hypothetical protein